jgi:hypothetical protein
VLVSWAMVCMSCGEPAQASAAQPSGLLGKAAEAGKQAVLMDQVRATFADRTKSLPAVTDSA